MRPRTGILGLAIALAAGSVPAGASAQAYQCRMPARVAVPTILPDQPSRRLPTTGYTLALSWSPEFCKRRAGQSRHRTQCSGRNGRFGFILHGLWPESGRSWPQWCPTIRALSSAEIRRNMCMTPSAALLARQWAKHGSCMARRPETYFAVARIMYDALTFPDMDRLSREDGLNAGRLRAEFARLNKGWDPDVIGLKLNQRGWLQEMQLCHGKDFMPKPCDRRRYGAKDTAPLKIWRGA